MQRKGLWGHADFLKLWGGQSVSMIGSQVTLIAVPLIAADLLQATPAQMGLLVALQSLPPLLFGLFAGAWVERRPRRPVLIAADAASGLLLLLIPLAALQGWLRIESVYLLVFLFGTLRLFFEIAYRAYLPLLVGREQLVEGNGKLELSRSAAEIAGPGLGGGLIQFLSAPVAVLADAVSFLVSAACLAWIHAPEAAAPAARAGQNVWKEIREGLGLVVGSPVLRNLAVGLAIAMVFDSVLEAVIMLYFIQALRIGPALIGLIFSGGSVGCLIGALVSGWVTRRFGLGGGTVAGLACMVLGDAVIPLVRGAPMGAAVPALAAAQFAFGFGLTIFNVGRVSLSQSVTPDALQGRMNATLQFVMGLAPVGALLGGALGGWAGLTATLWVAVAGEAMAAAWLLLSPVRKAAVSY